MRMSSIRSDGCDLYHEQAGQGIPILLIHPAGATASTWGSATQELARIDPAARAGRVATGPGSPAPIRPPGRSRPPP
jgi:hypothetical protein